MLFMELANMYTEGYTKKRVEHRVAQWKDDINKGPGRPTQLLWPYFSFSAVTVVVNSTANLNLALLCAASRTNTLNSALRYIFVWRQNYFYIHLAWLLKSLFRL